MLSISRLYCGEVSTSDRLRYGHSDPKDSDLTHPKMRSTKPVIVWNCTQRCNLNCVHCYSHSQVASQVNEMTTLEGKKMIDSLARFGTPVLLFSGGEPLIREDLFVLAEHAVQQGLRAVISTNGTLLSQAIVDRLKDIGVAYVGVSLDGTQEVNDRFRGAPGAFEKAIQGIQRCRNSDLKVGIRFTITRSNSSEVPAIFQLIRQYDIPRICFYHLVYSGRATSLLDEALSHQQTREVVDGIIDETARLHREGRKTQVLTVDNHADGPYLYLRLKREGSARAAESLELLKRNGGNASGTRIGCVSWDGELHPDQFSRNISLGNIRSSDFKELWTNSHNDLLNRIRNKHQHLKGRCASCKWLDICAGNLRARAQAVNKDLWAPDPACYLTDEEIAAR